MTTTTMMMDDDDDNDDNDDDDDDDDEGDDHVTWPWKSLVDICMYEGFPAGRYSRKIYTIYQCIVFDNVVSNTLSYTLFGRL